MSIHEAIARVLEESFVSQGIAALIVAYRDDDNNLLSKTTDTLCELPVGHTHHCGRPHTWSVTPSNTGIQGLK